MSDIKKGDLVMVVRKACCKELFNHSPSVGVPWVVQSVCMELIRCEYCGFESIELYASSYSKIGAITRCLKKIDPPATGELDSVPVRMKEPV